MSLNPEPMGIVADDDERAISSLIAWRRSATRADKLRVWLALGGSREDFDAEHGPHDFDPDTWVCRRCGSRATDGTVVCVPHSDYEDAASSG